MPDSHDEHQKDPVVDPVDDAVIARMDAPLAVPADQPLGAAGARLLRQELDGRLDAAARRWVQLAERSTAR